MRALLVETDGLVQINGFDEPTDYFNDYGGRTWRAAPLNQDQFNQILTLIDSKIARDQNGQMNPVTPAKWGDGMMYDGKEKYSLSNLCSGWVNSMLKIANIPEAPRRTWRPLKLMKHLEPYTVPYTP